MSRRQVAGHLGRYAPGSAAFPEGQRRTMPAASGKRGLPGRSSPDSAAWPGAVGYRPKAAGSWPEQAANKITEEGVCTPSFTSRRSFLLLPLRAGRHAPFLSRLTVP